MTLFEIIFDNYFVLNAIISRYLCTKKNRLYVAFVDFNKAFDTIQRDKLYQILIQNGIKGHLMGAIRAIYNNTVKECVKDNQELSDILDCPVGLKQNKAVV